MKLKKGNDTTMSGDVGKKLTNAEKRKLKKINSNK